MLTVLKTSVQHIDENQLVLQIKAGNREEFEVLYERYSPTLYGIIKKIIPDKDRADDILQDVFVTIWQKIGTYDPSKGSIFTWMLNIARNKAIDECRSKKIKGSFVDLDANTLNKIKDAGTATRKLDYIGVNEQLLKIKPEHKELLDLIYFCDHTQVEVAEILNLPLGTVKTRVRTALLHLREVFK